MDDQSHDLPSEANAAQLVLKLLSVQPRQVTRFRTGEAHYVYDVTLPDQQHVDFLSEVGHIGNQNTVTETDDERITQLRMVFERLMRAMG
jgi:hypothetical protein